LVESGVIVREVNWRGQYVVVAAPSTKSLK
jgi:hypothetical protein